MAVYVVAAMAPGRAGSSQDPATVGALANLDAGAVCWSVSCSRGFFSVMAYIAAYDLLVWQPPEG